MRNDSHLRLVEALQDYLSTKLGEEVEVAEGRGINGQIEEIKLEEEVKLSYRSPDT